jgi:hypothetical protein
MSWVAEVTDFLVEQKREGVLFEEAWEAALFAFPPRMRELGYRFSGTLIADQEEQRGLAWLRGVMEAAYVDAPRPAVLGGGPSRLRGLRAALLDAGDSWERLPARAPAAGRGALAA